MLDEHLAKMTLLAYEALENAYSPYSTYKVGCCIYTVDGQYFNGCNIENASYGLTLCAEASSIASMITAGSELIKEVVIVNHLETACFPCGGCRQRILEHAADHNVLIHLCNRENLLQSLTLEALLPHSFCAKTMEKNL